VEKISQYLALEGNIRVLALQTLLSQIGLGMFYVIWQPYILNAGLSISKLGLVQTTINVTTGLGLFFWGYISDRYGRKPVILITLICRIIAICFLIVSDSFLAFISFGAFMGLTAMFYIGNPARNALITESVDNNQRGTALSTLITISQGVSTLVATLGGYIALRLGYIPIFYILILGDTLGTIICYQYLTETLQKRDDLPEKSLVDRIRNSLIPESELLRLYIALLCMGFSYAVAYSLLYGALSETFGFSTIQLGFMTTAFNLLWAIDSIPLGKLVDKIGRKRGLLMSNIMALVTPIGFLFTDRIELFIFFYAFSAIDIGFWIPSYTSYITEAVDQGKRSTVFAKMDAYSKISSIPAAWVSGILYEKYGFYMPMYVQIGTLIFVAFLLIGLKEPEET
jgi:MFS family permease